MKINIFNLFIVILGCLVVFCHSNAFALERRLYPVPLFPERAWIKSGILVEFPVKEYGVSMEEFLKQKSGLSPVETALQGYLNCQKEWTFFSCRNTLTDEKGEPYPWYTLIKILWRGPFSKPISKILMSVHMGNRVWFVLEPQTTGGKRYLRPVSFEKFGSNRYARADDIFDYFESYAVFGVYQSLLNPERY